MLLVEKTGKLCQEHTTPMQRVVLMSYSTSTEITGNNNTPLRMPTYVSNMPQYLVEECHTTIARWAVEESWKLGLHPLQIAAHDLFMRQHGTWEPYIIESTDSTETIAPWERYTCCKDIPPTTVNSELPDFKHYYSVVHVATQYHVKPSQLFDVYAQLCEEREVTPY